MAEGTLIGVTHTSKKEGVSLRITIPKNVLEKLDVSPGEIVGFYEKDGEIVIRKMK